MGPASARLDAPEPLPYLRPEMAILPIITAPDPRLKVISSPITEVSDATRVLMDDLLETMYAAPGIGLAAVQVGVPERLIVMDVARSGDDPKPLYLVNPEILEKSDTMLTFEEGCLSLPDQYADVARPDEIRYRFLDYDGNEVITEAEGLHATCIQHEMDHLDGVLFVDHISKVKRQMILRKLSKQKRQELKESA